MEQRDGIQLAKRHANQHSSWRRARDRLVNEMTASVCVNASLFDARHFDEVFGNGARARAPCRRLANRIITRPRVESRAPAAGLDAALQGRQNAQNTPINKRRRRSDKPAKHARFVYDDDETPCDVLYDGRPFLILDRASRPDGAFKLRTSKRGGREH